MPPHDLKDAQIPRKVLITSALPYANGPLHFGHIAGAYLPGDCYARFERLTGSQVLYVCGSDEYGVAITLSAELAGRSPKEHAEHFHQMNRTLFERLNFSFDHFSRTTSPEHQPLVQQYFLDLLEKGYVTQLATDQLYSKEDGRFLADRYVVGTCPSCSFENARGDECPECGASYEAVDLMNPRSKLTQAPLVLRQTTHWFLRLDRFKKDLLKWIAQKEWKPNVTKFVKNFVEKLKPRAITRDTKWGVPIPLPHTEGKRLYVWFDAPVGYISASKEWAKKVGDPDAWKAFWCDPKTKLVQFLGKDNIPFHAAIFPAMTMGQNEPFKLVDDLPANEFFLLEGKQFSKSEGWFIDLEDFFTHFTADQIRYTIAANAPETSDSEFKWKDFQNRCNSELVGKYGNLVNRVLTFAKKHCSGKRPLQTSLLPDDFDFLEKLKKKSDQIKELYATYKLRRASRLIMEVADLGNSYFDHKKPWKAEREAMETTVACCLECLKFLALTSSPILPEAAQKIWELLGYPTKLQEGSWEEIVTSSIPPGQSLKEPFLLFQKIEETVIKEKIDQLYNMSSKK